MHTHTHTNRYDKHTYSDMAETVCESFAWDICSRKTCVITVAP